MEDVRDSAEERAEQLIESVKGTLPKVVKQLELAAHHLPTGQDFHFYSNFKEFKSPVKSCQSRVVSLLTQISSLKDFHSSTSSVWPADSEEAYDWLVGVQDDLLERVDAYLDKSHVERKEKNQQKPELSNFVKKSPTALTSPRDVKVARGKDSASNRCPVPFHVRHIPRPQDKFDLAVDNTNTVFKHLGKRRINGSGDTGAPVPGAELGESTENAHPLEVELKEMAYMEPMTEPIEVKKPSSLGDTPFTFVDSLASLKRMADKLRVAGEIAVDLENHHYRSYQGFVCLMQVSTREEDFVVDTLTLRSQIGPCLGDIFSDPGIKKVMHGADRDIVWLQRDFGIYVCNMFDTGQAARVLQLQSAGLAFLLEHFCGVHADKRYQLADWRIRPLPSEMMKYAREDTHYLLFVHDMLRQQLCALSHAKLDAEDPWVQVYKRSRDICLQLYTKELFTEASFLQMHGLYDKQFRPEQLATVSRLYAWRDQTARKEDESTGYVLPNHLLYQLASEMPDNVRQLQTIVKGSQALVGRSAGVIVDLIRQAKENPILTPVEPHSRPLKDTKLQEVKDKLDGITKDCERSQTEEKAGASISIAAIQCFEAPNMLNSAGGGAIEGQIIQEETQKTSIQDDDTYLHLVRTPGPAVVVRKSGSMLFNTKRSKSAAVSLSPSTSVIPSFLNRVKADSQSSREVPSALELGASANFGDDPGPRVENGVPPTESTAAIGASTSSSINDEPTSEPTSTSDQKMTPDQAGNAADLKFPRFESTGDTLSCVIAPVIKPEIQTSKVSSEVKLTVKSKGFGASLFGRSKKQFKGVDEPYYTTNQVQARLKAQAVESTIALPFKTVLGTVGQVVSNATTVESFGITEAVEMLQPTFIEGEEPDNPVIPETRDDKPSMTDVILSEGEEPDSAENQERQDDRLSLEDVIMFDNEGGEEDESLDNSAEQKRHRRWWPLTGEERDPTAAVPSAKKSKTTAESEAPETPDSSFPLSLLEAHRFSKRRNRKRTREAGMAPGSGPGGASMEPSPGKPFHTKKNHKPNKPALRAPPYVDTGTDSGSFSYAEARKRLGVDNLYAEPANEDDNTGRGRGNKINKKPSFSKKNLGLGFDALRRVRQDPKPEGLPAAPRRQVYPMTGNRSATFKK